MVHFGDHVPGLCGPSGLHRELQHVCARRRLPRGQRGHGIDAGEILRIGADVRLHSDGADQRRIRGPVSGRAFKRTPALRALPIRSAGERQRSCVCDFGDDLFLVGKRQRHSGIERESSANHVRDHGDGSHDALLVRLYAVDERRSPAACAFAAQSHVFDRCARVVKPQPAALYRRVDRNPDWVGSFGSGHERRRDHGPGLSGD